MLLQVYDFVCSVLWSYPQLYQSYTCRVQNTCTTGADKCLQLTSWNIGIYLLFWGINGNEKLWEFQLEKLLIEPIESRNNYWNNSNNATDSSTRCSTEFTFKYNKLEMICFSGLKSTRKIHIKIGHLLRNTGFKGLKGLKRRPSQHPGTISQQNGYPLLQHVIQHHVKEIWVITQSPATDSKAENTLQ